MAVMFILLRLRFFKSKDGGEKKSCHQLLNLLISFHAFIPHKLLVTMILLAFV